MSGGRKTPPPSATVTGFDWPKGKAPELSAAAASESVGPP
jgi:hypothetical protein